MVAPQQAPSLWNKGERLQQSDLYILYPIYPVCAYVCMFLCVLVTQSCLTFCGPMDCSPLGSSVHGILQARILESQLFFSPGDLPDPGIELRSPALRTDSLLTEPPGKLYQGIITYILRFIQDFICMISADDSINNVDTQVIKLLLF